MMPICRLCASIVPVDRYIVWIIYVVKFMTDYAPTTCYLKRGDQPSILILYFPRHEKAAVIHGSHMVTGGDMKETALRSGQIVAATIIILPVLLGEGMLHAQSTSPPTIDSRDTRTLEDTRGQDPRQNPGPLPPSAIELMKRLKEGKDPDSLEGVDPSKAQNDGAKPNDIKPHAPPSAGK
jgi:hypothetical protein